jgi:diacylglycerol kinase (ATP)
VSGGGRGGSVAARAQRAIAAIERHGDGAEVFVTERHGHARELAKSAVRRGARLVMAWGGDGTINEVASALAFDEVPLGIIPAGSGNGLAGELGISRRPEVAIASALAAVPRAIDVGEIDGHLFVNVAGVGFDAYVAAAFNAPGNRRRGLLGYVRLGCRALVTYVPRHYCLDLDGARSESRAVLIGVANGAQYGNNARIAPSATVDDGLLDLIVVEESSRLRTLLNVPRLFSGAAERVRGYRSAKIRRGSIESDGPIDFHVDGEPMKGGASLKIRVHPGALMIAC